MHIRSTIKLLRCFTCSIAFRESVHLLLLLLLLSLVAVVIDEPAMAEEPLQTTTIPSEPALLPLREILEYAQRERLAETPVLFEARLVFAGPKRSWFSVQDDQRAVRVTCPWSTSEKIAQLKLGSLIRVRGKTVAGRRDIALESYQVIDQAGKLQATPIWTNSVDSPLPNYSLAEMEGVVKEIHVGPHGSNFLVQSGIIWFRVDVDQVRSAAPSIELLGRIVKFKGAIAPATGQRNVNYFLHCMDYEQIESQARAPQKDLSERTVTVLYSDHIDRLIVEDQGRVSLVGTSFSQFLNPGDEISILEDRRLNAAPFQKKAVVGVVHHSKLSLPPGVPVTIADLLNANQPPSRVVLSGQVVHSELSASDMVYSLQSDRLEYEVRVPKWQSRAEHRIVLGDTLRVTGSPLVQPASPSSGGKPTLQLFVGSKDDVSVISTRAIISGSQLLIGFAAVGGVIGVFLLWNYSLRRQIAARSKKLLELNAQLKDSYDAVDQAVLFSNHKGQIVNANKQFANIFGFEVNKDMQVADIFTSITHLCTHPNDISSLICAASGDDRFSTELTITLGTTSKIVSSSFSSVQGAERQRIGSLWTFSDITENRKLEEKLAQARKMQLAGQLSGGIAHDFNNLLAVIKSNLALCDKAELRGGSISSFTRMAGQAVDSAARLTQQLLDFAKRSQLSLQEVNVHELLMHVHSLATSTMAPGIRFILDYRESRDLCIMADVTRLEQVMLNLCLNSIDAVDTAEGEIHICCYRTSSPAGVDEVNIEVQDNGCGIEPSIADRIFDPFFTTKPLGQGTGLGLSMVMGLVEQMGGTINFMSSPGVGTTFSIVFPLLAYQVTTEKTQNPLILGVRRPIHVMVVDDDELVRQSIAALLSSAGHDVRCASDGQEALQLLDQGSQVEVAVLDMAMPVLGGVEAGKIIRSRWPDIKILFLSGNPTREFNYLDTQDGTLAYLNKPFDPDVLESTVEQLAALSIEASSLG
jgi:signal transduction histidine kinase/CheY-like chemotaxis protein